MMTTAGRNLLLSAGFALTLLGTPAAAQTGGIRLENAAPEEIGRQVEAAVGAPVQLRGGAHQRLTLALPAIPPRALLDRVALALGGTWRIRLHVQAGRPAQPVAAPRLEDTVAIGLRDVAASRAFTLIARDLKAELSLQGDLRRRVTFTAAGVPASEVLDRLAELAGATWSVSYLIQVPEQAPAPQPAPAPAAPAPPPSNFPLPGGGLDVYVPAVPARPVVRPQPVPRAPSSEALRTGLWDALNYVIRIGPDQRAAAVGDFIQYGEETFTLLSRLPPDERARRIREAIPVLDQWRRLYRGLAPTVAKELAPIDRFLEQHLRVQ